MARVYDKCIFAISMSTIISKYFRDASPEQQEQFAALPALYREWNARINVISRKDMDNIEVHHILHSLAIARYMRFVPETTILDIGTGGGFPGIPLAILFPRVSFHLVDGIAKKILVVDSIVEALGLKNVKAEQCRAEELITRYDFVVSRAVSSLDTFYPIASKRISSRAKNSLPNGILYLRGGDVANELSFPHRSHRIFPVADWFDEPFFETKLLIHLI